MLNSVNLETTLMKNILISALLTSCVTLTAQAADPATVNGKPIKQSLIDFIIKEAVTQGRQIDDNARANIIEKLITNEVIDQEAQRAGIDKQPDFIAKEELTRHELRVSTYIEDYLRKNPIEDKTLQSEYERQKSQLSGQEYKASHILVNAESEAKDIIDMLSKGRDFDTIAKEKSLDVGSKENGGDLGWFTPTTMIKPFSDAVVKLAKGSITLTPIQTDFGWHVIKLEDAREAQAPSFDTVKTELRNNLVRQQLDKLVNDLKTKAKIVNNYMSISTK